MISKNSPHYQLVLLLFVEYMRVWVVPVRIVTFLSDYSKVWIDNRLIEHLNIHRNKSLHRSASRELFSCAIFRNASFREHRSQYSYFCLRESFCRYISMSFFTEQLLSNGCYMTAYITGISKRKMSAKTITCSDRI
jgi:hypothetical protein